MFNGIITTKSNGFVTIAPLGGGNVPGKVEMGDEVEVTLVVTRTAEEVERANAKKSARAAEPEDEGKGKKK